MPPSGTEERSLWAAFTVENSIWNGDNTLLATNGRIYGPENVNGGTAWYPAGGARQEVTTQLTWGGELGFIWSATATEKAAYDLYSSRLAITYANAGAARAAGLPVRCVRE